MSNHSRRAVLAGIAATPALAAPSLALSAVGPDPIFAAIEHHKAAYALHIADVTAEVEPEDRWLEASANAEIDAAWGLVAKPPTTLAGAAALAAYTLEYKLSDLSFPDTSGDFAAALLRSLHSAMIGEAVS